jgi:hypothetical protein
MLDFSSRPSHSWIKVASSGRLKSPGLLHCMGPVLALPGGSLRRSKSSGIESAADDLPASSAPPPDMVAKRGELARKGTEGALAWLRANDSDSLDELLRQQCCARLHSFMVSRHGDEPEALKSV